MTTYRALKFPLISKNSFEQERIFRSMNAVEAVVAIDNTIKKIGIYVEKDASLRRHIRPRLSILLGQHKRHEIDLAKSPVAHDTVVAISIVFLIIRTIIIKNRKKKRKSVQKLGMASLG